MNEFSKVLNCTECGIEKVYTNPGSYKNAKHYMRKRGYLLCQSCIEKRGTTWRDANPDKMQGRPKGSKTNPKLLPGKGHHGWAHITIEDRQLAVARRSGFSSYEEYLATMPAWKRYRLEVWRLTYKQPWKTLPNVDKRGRCGVSGAYQIDHIIGIKTGFNNNIPPEEIAHISNLRMIPWEENRAKH